MERGPFPMKNSRSGRARPIPKSNRVRAHPKASLRPAVASGCCRRAPPPPISSAKQESGGGLAVGQNRRPGRPGIRRAPPSAPARPRIRSTITQPEMPERTPATATLGQRFRSGRAEAYPIAPRRRRQIETAGRAAALARARKRSQDMKRGTPSAGGFDRVVKRPTRQLRAGAAGSKPLAEGHPRAREKTERKRVTRSALTHH